MMLRRRADETSTSPPTALARARSFAGRTVTVAASVVALVLVATLPAFAQSAQPATGSPSVRPTIAPDQGFKAFLEGLWPQARDAGITRETFDAAVRGLEPDLTLPDLILPGREQAPPRGQAEFTRPPQDYLDARQLAGLAKTGRALLARHAATLAAIEADTGVDRFVLLAIWGRETAFGTYKLPHDAIRVLATQAWRGRRKDEFRGELIAALGLLQAGTPRAMMRASWAGALGLTQFLPSEITRHGRDFDGDGKVDLFTSVPDALASAAQQLAAKGWVRGVRWGFEAEATAAADCSLDGPDRMRPIAAWQSLGYRRATGGGFTATEAATPAYLVRPAGTFGPAVLATENFIVIRRYNTSDLYALFVGNLADRIAGGGDFVTRWSDPRQLATRDIEEIQRRIQAAGLPVSKIDGKIGSNTRAVIGAYQKQAGIAVTCWPTAEVLAQLRRSR